MQRGIRELREEYGSINRKQPDVENGQREEEQERNDEEVSVDGKENVPNGDKNDDDLTVSNRLGTLNFQRTVRCPSNEDEISPTERSASLAADAASKLSQFDSHQTVNSLPVKVTDRQIERCATILSTNEMIAGRARSAKNDVSSG